MLEASRYCKVLADLVDKNNELSAWQLGYSWASLTSLDVLYLYLFGRKRKGTVGSDLLEAFD